MCSKCKFTNTDGNCLNTKADMYRRQCPGQFGVDVNDCPTVDILKKCSSCNLKSECGEE